MFSLKFVLLYFVIFFIYLSFKLTLFMRFTRYGNKLANSEDSKKNYKKSLEIKRLIEEISDIELKMWYEDSVFSKVSGIAYSRRIALAKYEMFLQKDENFASEIAKNKGGLKEKTPVKKDDEEDDTDKQPLFKIQFFSGGNVKSKYEYNQNSQKNG